MVDMQIFNHNNNVVEKLVFHCLRL